MSELAVDRVPVAVLPPEYRGYALDVDRVGLAPEHPWRVALPVW